MPDINVFDRLLGFEWRGIGLPYVSTTFEIRHDLAIHKPTDRDGADVENTGVAPLEFTFDIPFLNTIAAGQSESWEQPLYPVVFQRFVQAFQDKTRGTLQHPQFGPVTCKPNHATARWIGTERAGIRVQASFLQTLTDEDSLAQLATPSSKATLDGACADLDLMVTVADFERLPNAPTLPTFPTTFSQFANQVRGTVDQVTILQKQYAGALQGITSQATALENSVELAKGATGALLWPVLSAAAAAKASARAVAKTILQKGRRVAIYYTPADKTLGAVVADIGQFAPVTVEDVIKLNPALVSANYIPANSAVRYYAAA